MSAPEIRTSVKRGVEEILHIMDITWDLGVDEVKRGDWNVCKNTKHERQSIWKSIGVSVCKSGKVSELWKG